MWMPYKKKTTRRKYENPKEKEKRVENLWEIFNPGVSYGLVGTNFEHVNRPIKIFDFPHFYAICKIFKLDLNVALWRKERRIERIKKTRAREKGNPKVILNFAPKHTHTQEKATRTCGLASLHLKDPSQTYHRLCRALLLLLLLFDFNAWPSIHNCYIVIAFQTYVWITATMEWKYDCKKMSFYVAIRFISAFIRT